MITGSLQEKKGHYYAVLNLKENGKRKPKWIPLGLTTEKKNRKAAEGMLVEFIHEYSQRERANLSPDGDMLFVDYLQSWLKTAKASIAISTFYSYSEQINGRIDKWFRPLKLKLSEVTPSHLEKFYQSILDDDLTTNTVIHNHAVLRRALQSAVKKEIILKNPADCVDRPKKNTYVAEHYSREEVQTLLTAIEGDELELPVTIAAYYGLRRSEVLGIHWSAIDFEHKTMEFNHKVIEIVEDGKTIPKGEDVLKTKSSRRTLPLIPVVEEKLLEQKKRQEVYRKPFKNAYCQDYLDYVCVDELGRLLRPNYLTSHFKWLLQKYGLKEKRFHDLRHTCATLLLESGVPMKSIQIWLGHSTFATTADIYAHLDYRAQLETSAVMGEMYSEKPEQTADATA